MHCVNEEIIKISPFWTLLFQNLNDCLVFPFIVFAIYGNILLLKYSGYFVWDIHTLLDRGNLCHSDEWYILCCLLRVFACGVFIDLQKAFDTINHDILLSKLNHYGIREVAFDWFKSYLSNRTQYVTINNERSEIQTIKYGVPQGSILGPLLFLIYINDLSRSIKNLKIHHFADDTNLLYASSSLKDINKKINFDLSNLVQWLQANKIALNVNKTDIIIFQSPTKQITKKMNFRLSGQKITALNILH